MNDLHTITMAKKWKNALFPVAAVIIISAVLLVMNVTYLNRVGGGALLDGVTFVVVKAKTPNRTSRNHTGVKSESEENDVLVNSAKLGGDDRELHAAPEAAGNCTTSTASEPASTSNTSVRIAAYNPKDRMGSKAQLAVGAWALSKANNWSVCSTNDDAIAVLGSIPICDLQVPYHGDVAAQLGQPGLYNLKFRSKASYKVWRRIASWERDKPGSVWNNSSRSEWEAMIMNAAPKERFWKSSRTIKIAVHIRRGDVEPTGKWAYSFIQDNAFLQLIALCKDYLNRQALEVHIFSEDYGATNWSLFDSNDTYFHLAPKDNTYHLAPGNLTENLRDWAHFCEADILIAGGTFSVIPALARPLPSANGLPLTIFYGGNYGYLSTSWYPNHWLPWIWQPPTQVNLTFPSR
jgi:hypothetical protein